MTKNPEKHVQTQLGVDAYLKIREYATLHGLSLSSAIKCAVEEFIKIKEINTDVNKETIKN